MPEEPRSEQEAIDAMLWRAYRMGVASVNKLNNKDTNPVAGSNAAALRRLAAGFRAIVKQETGLLALLRDLAQGEATLDRSDLKDAALELEQDEKTGKIFSESKRANQELAQRLIAFVDRNDASVSAVLEQRKRRR